MNIFCYFILHTTRESLGGISQYQRKHYCVPLTYFTYLTPLSISSGSRTVIVCGIPDPLTAESTLEKLLTALVLLFTPLMVAQWHEHQCQQEAVAATAVAGDNRQQHMGQLRFCSSYKQRDSLVQGIASISTRIILKLKGRNYSAIIGWPYVQVKYNYCAVFGKKVSLTEVVHRRSSLYLVAC